MLKQIRANFLKINDKVVFDLNGELVVDAKEEPEQFKTAVVTELGGAGYGYNARSTGFKVDGKILEGYQLGNHRLVFIEVLS